MKTSTHSVHRSNARWIIGHSGNQVLSLQNPKPNIFLKETRVYEIPSRSKLVDGLDRREGWRKVNASDGLAGLQIAKITS